MISRQIDSASNGCVKCGATDKPLTGTARDRHCTNSFKCAVRFRTRLGEAPQKRTLEIAPDPTVKPRAATETPAEVMISLLQERSGIDFASGELEYGESLRLPLAAAQGRYVCFGKSGSGKSNASAVVIENCLENDVPVCAIDTLGNLWGLRREAGCSGLPIPIIGGTNGDLPLRLEYAGVLAQIFSQGKSFLLDLSDLTREEQQSFSGGFFKELLRVLRIPAHVVVEEAETICPAFTRSKTQFASQGAVSLFARQIRNFGVGWTFSTQRLPLLHPDVIDASNAFIAMQTTGDGAQRAIQREAKTRVGAAIASVILNELGQLPVGYAWLVPDPSLFETEVGAPVRFRFRKRRTYDSTAVPRIGAVKLAPPAPVKVDLRAFKALK